MMTQCLIDADILSYQCAFAGQYKDESSGEIVVKDFKDVEEVLQLKVREITEECMSDEEPILFLTGDDLLAKLLNRRPKWDKPLREIELLPSFRYYEAVTKEYKGQRKQPKPYHYHNIRAYILSEYETVVSNGLEADDMLSIYQNDDTVICSLDKDLRQVPGKHYSWSLGKRESSPIETITYLGNMELTGKPQKLKMSGMKAFFAQTLMGDPVDNIRGIEKFGPVAAYEALNKHDNELDLFVETAYQYKQRYLNWEKLLREHIDLTYMIRRLDDEGKPVKYEYPEGWRLRLDQKENSQDVVECGQKPNTETL